jgi:hypothetical protein
LNFRLLTTEELEPLTHEFTLFLAANGIDAPMWEKMKLEQQEAVAYHIKHFSDSVWFKIFTNKRYLDYKDDNAFFYMDFLASHCIILKSQKSINSDVIELSMIERNYSISREEDMYQWMEQGAVFSEGKNYKEACILWAENKKISLN